MLRIATLAAIFAAVLTSGCAKEVAEFKSVASNVYDVVTTAKVSPAAVEVAASAFDGVEATATNYLRLPRCGKQPCRDPKATAPLRKAMIDGRAARNTLERFLIDHPGQLGPGGAYDALTAATAALKQVFADFNVIK